MLHITVGTERRVDPAEDELGRDRVGYSPSMSPNALFDAVCGAWKVGPRAHKERFMIAAYDGIVRLAVEIKAILPVRNSDRSVVQGTILRPGHPVYDRYVGKSSPLRDKHIRNPITYIEDMLDGRPCHCGCGSYASGRDFLPGHDQKAIHERITQIGTVMEFLDWFDIVRGNKSLQAVRAE